VSAKKGTKHVAKADPEKARDRLHTEAILRRGLQNLFAYLFRRKNKPLISKGL